MHVIYHIWKLSPNIERQPKACRRPASMILPEKSLLLRLCRTWSELLERVVRLVCYFKEPRRSIRKRSRTRSRVRAAIIRLLWRGGTWRNLPYLEAIAKYRKAVEGLANWSVLERVVRLVCYFKEPRKSIRKCNRTRSRVKAAVNDIRTQIRKYANFELFTQLRSFLAAVCGSSVLYFVVVLVWPSFSRHVSLT